jgi:FKBP-type peptidyl-prolyl cis-trans isomerase
VFLGKRNKPKQKPQIMKITTSLKRNICYTITMKYKFILIAVALITLLIFGGCSKVDRSLAERENFGKDASYALGMDIGSMMAGSGVYPNMDEFLQGLKDSLAGVGTRFDEFEAWEILNDAFMTLNEVQSEGALQEGLEFLAENSMRPDVTVTPSGLQYEVSVEGDGPKPTESDFVRVHYEGSLIDGTIFDSSYSRGTPIELPLFGVISGWAEGLQLMSVGSRYRLYIPQELGYGSMAQNAIPPYSTLIFDVELLDILDPSEVNF